MRGSLVQYNTKKSFVIFVKSKNIRTRNTCPFPWNRELMWCHMLLSHSLKHSESKIGNNTHYWNISIIISFISSDCLKNKGQVKIELCACACVCLCVCVCVCQREREREREREGERENIS